MRKLSLVGRGRRTFKEKDCGHRDYKAEGGRFKWGERGSVGQRRRREMDN